MSDFKIGDEVVTKGDSTPRSAMFRKNEEIVTVTGVQYCPCCGSQKINVNNRSFYYTASDIRGYFVCSCRHIITCGNVGWAGSFRFAPLQTASEESDMEQSIKEAFEKELFEV